MFGNLLYDIIFFEIPAVCIVLFVISLCRYVSAKKQNKNAPGTFPPEEILKRKIYLIFASVISGIFAAVVIGFMVLMYMVIAYM